MNGSRAFPAAEALDASPSALTVENASNDPGAQL